MCIVRDITDDQWICLSDPCEVVSVSHIDNVVPELERIETAVNEQGLYAAGFISYEASPAYDSALRVHPASDFPLLWFGLYPKAEKMTLPALPDKITHIPGQWTPSVSKAGYDEAIACVKAHIAQGNTYQVNYTFRLNATFSGDARSLFLELMAVQETKYAAYIDTGRFAVCSASPELFFSLNGEELRLRPMKGTAPRGMTLSEDKSQALQLHYSEKNRAENIMIVDMIRNDAGRIAVPGSVTVPKCFEVEKYPTVWQMTSTVTAKTDASLCNIMAALFPCASITGAPKSSTMNIIANLETTPRNVYTGCIGLIAPERKARFSIAIRTVIADRETKQAEYGVGGGIVWDSDTEGEYEECKIKARVLSESRPDFSLLESLLWEPETGYFLTDYHIRRMSDSAEYFDFPFDAENIREKLGEISRSFDKKKSYKVRLLLSKQGTVSCQSQPIDMNLSAPVRIGLSLSPVNSGNPFLYHKTTYRQMYETAVKNCPGADDVILYNERGEVTETTIANIVIQYKGKRITPPVRCGLLAGTFRAYLMDQGEIEEDIIPVAMLAKSEHIYVINSVRLWRKAVLASA